MQRAENDYEDDHDPYDDDELDFLLRDPEERFTYGVGFSWVTLATVTTYLPTKLIIQRSLTDAMAKNSQPGLNKLARRIHILSSRDRRQPHRIRRPFCTRSFNGIARHAISEGTSAHETVLKTDTSGQTLSSPTFT